MSDYYILDIDEKEFYDLLDKQIIENSLPEKLFKFISFDNDDSLNNKKIKSLEANEIWFQNILGFNDIYENKSIYVDKMENPADWDVLQLILDKINRNTYATCFSEEGINNFSMWGNYANNFQGICVEYKVKNNNNNNLIKKVRYEEKPIQGNIFLAKIWTLFKKEIVHKKLDVSKSNEVMNKLQKYVHTIMGFSFVKSIHWKHEREFRIVAKRVLYGDFTIDKENKTQCDNFFNGFNVPLDELGLEVSAVYVTEKCDKKIYKLLQQIFQKKLIVLKAKDDSFELFEETD